MEKSVVTVREVPPTEQPMVVAPPVPPFAMMARDCQMASLKGKVPGGLV